MSKESYEFSADINQLMHLIVNAFYSKKEVFLRELLSNASDALDKIRYQSLTDKSVLGNSTDLKIQLTPNTEDKTLTITDTGIGMTKEDLINTLGTVAKSGTKAFMEYLKEKDNQLDLIGQFGVGFYSAYLVSDKVTVITKHNDDIGYIWESNANGSFTIEPYASEDLERGTRIILTLKEDCHEFLTETTVKELVMKHSQYISFPIELLVEKTEEVEIEDEETENNETVTETNETVTETNEAVTENNETENVTVEDVDENEEPVKKTKKVTTMEWEQLNEQKPIWTRKPEDVTADEYASFYKSISNDHGDYAGVKHFSVEGNVEFSSLLFVPENKPFDMFQGGEEKVVNKIKLYVRRVFILDNCKDLLPEYLNFVAGVVDSNDLPLNVSREMIQENRVLRIIKKQLVKKTIDLMTDLTDNKEKYTKFYDAFSKNIKLGVYEDSTNRDKLSSLLRYQTTKSNGELVSLDEYVERMPEGQKSIYYLSGENIKSIENSPFLEQLNKRGHEVLFMTEAIDEYMLQQFKDFKEKTLVDVSKEDLGLEQTDEEKDQFKADEEDYKTLCEHVKEILKENVSKVSISNKIVDTPCVLSASKFGWSANMQRIMKAQALGDNSMQQFMMGQKIFELNPASKTIQALKTKFEADNNDAAIKDLVWLLYESSMLNSGFSLDDPSTFTKRLNKIINLGLNLEDNEPVETITNDEVVVNADNEVVVNDDNDNGGEQMEQVD